MKYIGIEEEVLKARHGYYAAYGIERQPQLWRQVYENIQSHKSTIQTFFSNLKQESDLKVLLMGAGSSNLAARSVAHHGMMHTPWKVICEPSTKVILDPQEYFQEDQPLLLVSFGSSGNTPEGVACNRLPIQYNKDKSENPRKINGLSDLSLFLFPLFSIKNQPKTKGQKERFYINDKSEF